MTTNLDLIQINFKEKWRPIEKNEVKFKKYMLDDFPEDWWLIWVNSDS